MKYEKRALTFHEQVDLITGRGLAISNKERALRWLQNVSYYRLSAYFLPFKNGAQFETGATFDDVAGLYIFDRKLRLVLDAIERIEVALRTALTYEIAHRCGPFGYTDPRNFDRRFRHDELMAAIRAAETSSTEPFVRHYRRKYCKEAYLPLWMASELLSLGWMSRIYSACHPQIKRKIAGRFSIQDAQFSSWLHSLNYVRNVCAHHSRLWNRELAIRPSLPRPSAGWPYGVCRARTGCIAFSSSCVTCCFASRLNANGASDCSPCSMPIRTSTSRPCRSRSTGERVHLGRHQPEHELRDRAEGRRRASPRTGSYGPGDRQETRGLLPSDQDCVRLANDRDHRRKDPPGAPRSQSTSARIPHAKIVQETRITPSPAH